jgi:hypothetical protein
MRLGEALEHVAARAPERFDDVRRHIDPEWIEQALHATGTATIRRRRLPAIQVVWLVIGMALFRNRSISELVGELDLALPGRNQRVAEGSVPQARARLGPEPMQWLFSRTSDEWAHASARAHEWRGLALYAVDGTTMRIADSYENRNHFGGTRGHRGPSGYPLVRVVGLVAVRSHILASAAFGAYDTGEQTYATELWPCVPDNSLTMLDKGLFAAHVLIPLTCSGTHRHWLTPAKKNFSHHITQRFSRNDFLVELKVSPQARKKDPTLPKTWTVRAIRYHRKGFRPRIVLTSLLDPIAYPAKEIADLYHERWEIELAYKEIKTHLLERRESLRSKSPKAVTQELWGILIAYNLIRLEIERAADDAGIAPNRISFIAALHLITDEWMCTAFMAAGAIPRRLEDLRIRLLYFTLPPRRSERRYPRAVKIKMSKFPRNRRSPSKKR